MRGSEICRRPRAFPYFYRERTKEARTDNALERYRRGFLAKPKARETKQHTIFVAPQGVIEGRIRFERERHVHIVFSGDGDKRRLTPEMQHYGRRHIDDISSLYPHPKRCF